MIRLISTLLLLTGIFFSANGQTGVIEGIVKDMKSGEMLVGANVIIQGTTTGTITNLNGEFRLANVSPGNINLYVSYISYDPLIIENISVQRGQTANVVIELEEAGVQLEAVEVTARRVTHTEISLLSTIRTSQVVVSGVSAQQISRSQDSDAAEIVRRIPAVSLIEYSYTATKTIFSKW